MGSTFKSKLPSFSIGLAKVIAWGFLTLVLLGITFIFMLGLVYGIITNWTTNGGHPPSILATGFWVALLLYGDYWAIKKLRLAYAQYRRQKMQGRLS